MASDETIATLQGAVQGLTYPSETDSPWTAVDWRTAAGVPAPEGIRKFGKLGRGERVTEVSLADFFAPLTVDRDWYGAEEKAISARYRALRELLTKLLASPKVFRVAGPVVTVYIVGIANGAGWAGLKTTAVET